MIARLIIVMAALIGSAHAQVQTSLVAPACGEFTPMITKVNPASSYAHFFPKMCNKILIGDAVETIPPGTGVAIGGVVLDSSSACIDKVCGLPMQPATTYYVYGYCKNYTPSCNMALNLSTVGHKESPDYGHQIHRTDRTQTLVGMVRLMKDNLIAAGTGQQPTISWLNRGVTGLAVHIGNGSPRARTCSPTYAPPEAIDSAGNVIPGYKFSLEWLSFAINSELGPYLPPGYPAQYGQAFTVPNVKMFGTMTTSVNGGEGYAILADLAGNTIGAPSYFRHEPGGHTYGNIYVEEYGAVPDNEGYAKVQLLMRTTGTGCVTIEWGTLGVDKLPS